MQRFVTKMKRCFHFSELAGRANIRYSIEKKNHVCSQKQKLLS